MKQHRSLQQFSIIVALLALAVLSCSGAAGVTNLFATDTPTPTNTFTPSPTLTPSSTPSPTLTPSPSPTPAPTGSTTEKQADGSTVFTDYDNQYQVILPDGWMVLPLSSGDMADIIQGFAEKNPEYKDIAETLKNLDPNMIRVIAINMNPKHIFNGLSTTIGVMALDNKMMSSMPMDFVTGALEESIQQEGAQVISTETMATMNANGVEVGTLEYMQTAPSPTGAKVPIHYKVILFKAGDKMIMVQLGTPKQFSNEVLPIIDQIKDSVKLIE